MPTSTLPNTVRLPLTVVIPTYNEAEHIADLLSHLQWAAEIIVVDSLSTDETVALARAGGATVLERPLDTIGRQKNWAIAQAQYPWVFIIDADERPTPELVQEITAIVQKPNIKHVGYVIRRQNFFMGVPVYYGGLQRDRVIRLIRRDDCAYDLKQVHEAIQTKGSLGLLECKLLHNTYKNLSHFLEKQRKYAEWSAQDHAVRVKRVTYAHLFLKPLGRFFIQYFAKRGFLDGKAGLVYCAINAWTVFLRYVYLLEQRRDSKVQFPASPSKWAVDVLYGELSPLIGWLIGGKALVLISNKSSYVPIYLFPLYIFIYFSICCNKRACPTAPTRRVQNPSNRNIMDLPH